MILGGTPFIRISCFVVGSVVLVSLSGYCRCCLCPRGCYVWSAYLYVFFLVYKVDYHGPEEGEMHDHH